MTTQLSPFAAAYLQATNHQDATAFAALFAEEALVTDINREIRGRAAIEEWAQREIFNVQVTMEPLEAAEHDGETMLTVKIDGTFDKTGLPDPLIMVHTLGVQGGKISRLSCQLK